MTEEHKTKAIGLPWCVIWIEDEVSWLKMSHSERMEYEAKGRFDPNIFYERTKGE